MNAAWARDRRKGSVLIVVAVVLVVLVGFVGLALDAGVAALTLHQIQNAADAAALAGCRLLADPNGVDLAAARTAAVAVAAANQTAGVPLDLDRNDGNAENGDIVLGRYERLHGTFRATEEVPNAVLVNGRRTGDSLTGPLPLLFGPAFGTETVNLDRYAIAMNQSPQISGAGFIVLSPHDNCALNLKGGSIIRVTAMEPYSSAIQVNSDDPCAVCGEGTITIDADELDIVGDDPGFCVDGGSGTITADINPGSPAKPDPFAALQPDPSWQGWPDLHKIKDSGTYGPGYYSGGINLSGGDVVTLSTGIYVLDGDGLVVKGGAELTANNVLFYVKGSGKVELGGGGGNTKVVITPSQEHAQDPAHDYYHVSIFQARENENDASIMGSSGMNLTGVFYFPKAPVEIGGNAGSFDNMVIAWTFLIHGNANIHVAYSGEFVEYGSFIYLVK